jgi:hypothetical protein
MHGGGGMGGGMHGGGMGGGMRAGGMGGGMHAGGGMRFGGGGGGAMHVGGAAPAFRGAQASMAPSANITPSRPVAVGGGNFAGPGGAQFAQGGYRGGFRDHDHHRGRHFGPGFGFAAGLAAGSALGYGYGGYYDPYYYDNYAYNDYYDDGDVGYVGDPGYVVSSSVDPAYCAQRYKSYDPASGTYLGYDGLRHPCGQ